MAAVVSITIDNPPINLMDLPLIRDLRALLDALEGDADCRVAVFASAVPDFFLSHFDLNIVLDNIAKTSGHLYKKLTN